MIYIASDHAAYDFKQHIIEFLQENGLEFENLGTDSLDRVHYTDFAMKLSSKILENNENVGILICGTGIGMSIMANRLRGIRAAVCTNEYMARMTKRHNNANVLCLGSRVIGEDVAKGIILSFLNSDFEGGRHKIRTSHYDEYICTNDQN